MVRHVLLAALLLALAGCLPPWPLGDPSPGMAADDDDGAGDDDAGDDDAGDDDAGDDDAGDDDAGDDDAGDDDIGPVDGDGDGWPEDEDCDDADGKVNPGATELPCDGIDNDCDGASPCDPCQEGTRQDMGTIGLGWHSRIGSLAEGDQVLGLGDDHYFDLLRLTTGGMGLYSFDLVSTEFDAYLTLYHADCGLIGTDDNSGPGPTDAGIDYASFGAESLLLLLTAATGDGVGAYDLQIQALALGR